MGEGEFEKALKEEAKKLNLNGSIEFAGKLPKEKVRNFLTVFGWQKGKIITAISVFFAFIFFAFIMGGPLFFALSFIFAGLGAYFVVYYERIGEKASYLNFLIFIVLFLLFSFA